MWRNALAGHWYFSKGKWTHRQWKHQQCAQGSGEGVGRRHHHTHTIFIEAPSLPPPSPQHPTTHPPARPPARSFLTQQPKKQRSGPRIFSDGKLFLATCWCVEQSQLCVFLSADLRLWQHRRCKPVGPQRLEGFCYSDCNNEPCWAAEPRLIFMHQSCWCQVNFGCSLKVSIMLDVHLILFFFCPPPWH